MNTITESELIDAVRNKAVTRLHIAQNKADSRYRIVINLNWKKGDWPLVTARKKTPREWASLDRLALHIKEKYGAIPEISLSLTKRSGDTTK